MDFSIPEPMKDVLSRIREVLEREVYPLEPALGRSPSQAGARPGGDPPSVKERDCGPRNYRVPAAGWGSACSNSPWSARSSAGAPSAIMPSTARRPTRGTWSSCENSAPRPRRNDG